MPTSFKQTFINAYDRTADSIAKLFMLVPVDVDTMNFKPSEKTRVLHELIRHIQQSELYHIRGAITGKWSTDDIKWYVGKSQPMVDQIMANHREALELLESVDESDLLERHVTLSYMDGTLADVLFHNLDHWQHHRTQLFDYLKSLGQPLDSRTIWGDKYPV